MNDNDYEMYDISSQTSCSKNEEDDPTEEVEDEIDTLLWSIDDDTMFYAKGLKNHSAGKGKSVFVTWNENYLMNFVFKTSSKTKRTTLTKVRLTMPMCPGESEREEILDMLILEMNTLLLMQSGRVYYFSSVKSIHCVPWLIDVRCICSCPNAQFSIIRLKCGQDGQSNKQLLLEVYQDIPQLGKCPTAKHALRRSYDITFDIENVFNCNWTCDRYILLSLIASEDNIEFLRQIVSIGNIIRTAEEQATLDPNQEIHIFTVSGNLFALLGDFYVENGEPNEDGCQEYAIHLLNTYAATIESIQIDCRKNLLIVLLESGHMDIWYKSQDMFGSIHHLKHQISNFTHFDYNSSDNTFYITKPDEVTQLSLVISNELCEDELGETKECAIKEVHKAISGMVACTWVESLKQLICLSINNIFYRLCFDTSSKEISAMETTEGYENFNSLYSLTNKKMKLLLSRSQIVNNLMELPKQLHESVDLEWQKQQVLAMGSKNIWKKMFKCYIEYHLMESTIKSLNMEDNIFIRTTFDRDIEENYSHNMYSVLQFNATATTHRDKLFLTIMQATTWQLQLRSQGETLLMHIPSELLSKQFYIIVKFSTKNRTILPDFSLHILAFVKHCSTYICVRSEISCLKTELTYRNLFSLSKQINIYRSSKLNIDYIMQKFRQKKPPPLSSSLLRYSFKNLNIQDILTLFDISDKKYQNAEYITVYYLQEHAVEIKYDAKLQKLEISTENPEAIFYLKTILMWKLKSLERIDLTNSKSNHLQKILQCQSEIECLYGSLTSIMENDDGGGGGHCLPAASLHIENLIKMYLKIRNEFDTTFS
uniref:Uncharacterized protein n=1 Tax=Musca domestica TaxID=7370 RepID=A0A1I8MGH7_MUSDO